MNHVAGVEVPPTIIEAFETRLASTVNQWRWWEIVVGSRGIAKSQKKIEEDLPQQLNLIKFPYKELEAAFEKTGIKKVTKPY